MILLVIDRRTLVTFRAGGGDLMAASRAADAIANIDKLGEEQIAWSIEQCGRCDGMEYTIIPEEWEDVPAHLKESEI